MLIRCRARHNDKVGFISMERRYAMAAAGRDTDTCFEKLLELLLEKEVINTLDLEAVITGGMILHAFPSEMDAENAKLDN